MQGRKARKQKERRKERNKERKKEEIYTKSAPKYSFFSNTLIFSMGCLELYYLKQKQENCEIYDPKTPPTTEFYCHNK